MTMENEIATAVREVMIRMCLADGVVDSEEVATIRGIYLKMTGVEMTDDDVREQIAESLCDKRSMNEYLGNLASSLNDHGKEMVIRAAFYVAAADGEFQEEEQALLAEIGDALQMSRAHVKGVYSEMFEGGDDRTAAPNDGSPIPVSSVEEEYAYVARMACTDCKGPVEVTMQAASRGDTENIMVDTLTLNCSDCGVDQPPVRFQIDTDSQAYQEAMAQTMAELGLD